MNCLWILNGSIDLELATALLTFLDRAPFGSMEKTRFSRWAQVMSPLRSAIDARRHVGHLLGLAVSLHALVTIRRIVLCVHHTIVVVIIVIEVP